MTSSKSHLHPVFWALSGFFFWVLSDTCMKLAGENNLPPYEVVGFLGLFSVASLAIFYLPQKKMGLLWPKKPEHQIVRVLIAFGCLMCNAVALKHAPLTIFYVVVFTAPMMIAVLASVFLREQLGLARSLAIVAGFAGVIIAIDPWAVTQACDSIGYAAAGCSAFFYAISIVMARFMTKNETPESLAFFTACAETVAGFGLTMWHGVPVTMPVLGVMAAMGIMSVIGNVLMYFALKYATAATVEQFHYTQIIVGALLGYAIWHDVPNLHTILGAVVIITSGLYVAASVHYHGKRARLPTV